MNVHLALLLSLTLLLLALAQVRLGSPDRYANDHVLILDSSAWMAARSGQPAPAGCRAWLAD